MKNWKVWAGIAALVIVTMGSGLAQGTNGLANPANSEGISFFQGTWTEALAKAKKENKLIFVDAYAVWCGPCKFMAANVFPIKEVGDYFNSNFINYKFDMEKGEGPAFAKQYGVRAYPTLFYINGEGKIIHQDMGMKQKDDLLNSGKTAVSKKGNS